MSPQIAQIKQMIGAIRSAGNPQALMQQMTQENEMLKGQVANLKQVVTDQGKAIRSGMYAPAGATDQPLPEVDMNS